MQISAASITLGWSPPRELRSNAILLRLTESSITTSRYDADAL